MKNDKRNSPFDKDLDDFIIDYAGDMFQDECHYHQYDLKNLCSEGRLSIWEIFEASFQRMCKENDIESLKYILEEAPDYKVDLKYSNYLYLNSIIQNNSYLVFMFFLEQKKISFDKDFQDYFKMKKFPSNIVTSLIESCILNENLEQRLISKKIIVNKIKI